MKNDITDILFKYTTGEATLEETNEALKEAEAGFHLEPGKNEITPEEAAQTVTGETPEEVTGYGLLDTGTGSMESTYRKKVRMYRSLEKLSVEALPSEARISLSAVPATLRSDAGL